MTSTSFAALHCDRIDEPFLFDQPINGASFAQWAEDQLGPTLGPGDIVILDNLSSQSSDFRAWLDGGRHAIRRQVGQVFG